MTESVHQAVHGYANGHQELALSTRLDSSDRELLARLSDLSGSLSRDREFDSYLTFYPLPSERFYVVAKTWPDEGVTRPGCVLTHSLLVPAERWADMAEPHCFGELLRHPLRSDLGRFREPLVDEPARGRLLPSIRTPLTHVLTRRLFGEGLLPLAWFGETVSEDLAWRIVAALWPNARRQFAICTFALKPRALDLRPFDLVFAPVEARPRFAEFPREHVIQPSVQPEEDEPWLSRWHDCVFGEVGDVAPSGCKVAQTLSTGLESAPTAIRRVFAYLELADRAQQLPMAAVGAIDVLATLNLPSDVATKLKVEQGFVAVGSSRSLPDRETVELLYLLSERCAPGTSQRLDIALQIALSHVVQRSPFLLPSVERLVERRSGEASTVFIEGVADGVSNWLSTEPTAATALADVPMLGGALVASHPRLAWDLLRATRQGNANASSTIVIDWFRKLTTDRRTAFRLEVAPWLTSAEKTLAAELVWSASVDEKISLCRAVDEFPGAASLEVARMYASFLSSEPEVQRWALDDASRGALSAVVLAVTGEISEAMLDRLITVSPAVRSAVTVAFIERACRHVPSEWILRRLSSEPAIWELMLDSTWDIESTRSVERICERARRSAIARVPAVPTKLAHLPVVIRDHAIAQACLDWVETGGNWAEPDLWSTQEWFKERCAQGNSAAVRALTSRSKYSVDEWIRAWRYLAALPSSDAWSWQVVTLVDHLTRTVPGGWDERVLDCWVLCMRSLAPFPAAHSTLCARSLEFALRNPRAPLGVIAAAAFPTVHAEALREGSHFSVIEFLGWDRGRELRQRLIDAFCQGVWQPEWFVRAAGQPWLLRKLAKRMMRQWQGRQFLEQAYRASVNRKSATGRQLAGTLGEILSATEILEDWD